MSSSRAVANVVIENETERALTNQLIGAYQVAFTAADLVDIAKVNKDALVTSLRQAEQHVAGLNVALARRHLCKGIELSRRRGELIALAGHMADLGSCILPLTGEEEPVFCLGGCGKINFDGEEAFCPACSGDEDGEPNTLQLTCVDCLNRFPSVEALTDHLVGDIAPMCPVAAIRDQAEEARALELEDNAEYLDAQAGGTNY